jgi:hypothetical protein
MIDDYGSFIGGITVGFILFPVIVCVFFVLLMYPVAQAEQKIEEMVLREECQF